MITTNKIELWKLHHSNEYMDMVEIYGYDKAQEIVRLRMVYQEAMLRKAAGIAPAA